MKVAHYTAYNASGMNRVAESCVKAERELGIDSHLLNIGSESDWSRAFDADVHVAHTHFPDFYNGSSFRRQLTKPYKIVTLFHGTPEFVIRESLNQARHGLRHGMGDGVMMLLHWLAASDARVTFWPRHQAIYQTMVDQGTEVHCLPLGVDYDFWTKGKLTDGFAGTPSVFSAENPHVIKDPLDLVLLWPWVYPQLNNASLHLAYLAENQHRTYAPIINRNHSGYGMHWSQFMFSHQKLRDVFKSVDFFIGLVRYGDFNRLSLEANVAGAKTISYRGNPYSDYWITEGDQREMAAELLAILRGDVTPRVKTPVADAKDTSSMMIPIYESVLLKNHVQGFSLPFVEPKPLPPKIVLDLRPKAVE